jgi:hypothetical protein
MTVWVVRDGVLVEKGSIREKPAERSLFPSPRVSRLEPYESPIDGTEITSWGQRNRELEANNAYDPRDVKVKKDVRPRTAEPSPEQLSFKWTDPT